MHSFNCSAAMTYLMLSFSATEQSRADVCPYHTAIAMASLK
jgi:hypothetical protein